MFPPSSSPWTDGGQNELQCGGLQDRPPRLALLPEEEAEEGVLRAGQCQGERSPVLLSARLVPSAWQKWYEFIYIWISDMNLISIAFLHII